MDNMEIKHHSGDPRGVFYVEEDGKKLAQMTYTWAGTDRIIIDHTEVSDELRGTGTGKKLVLEAVAFARQKGIKIIPLCPYANSVFKRTPELRDVL